MKKLSISISLMFLPVLIFLGTTFSQAQENLDEMIARQQRQTSAAWGSQYLEDPSNYYIWQPESFCYTDLQTGTEVWVVERAPDLSEYYSVEHASNAWSFNGSKIGFFSSQRPTGNPAVTGEYHLRWIVNSDGSGLRACEGYGRRDTPFEGFGWAHTENSNYTFGSGSGEGSNSYTLYKNTVGENNVITGTLILNTGSVNTTKKELVKDGVSSNDSWIIARDIETHDAGPCNVRTTREMYFIHLDGTPAVDSHWGIARGIGPSGDPYGDHVTSSEESFHDVWAIGYDGNRIIGDYGSTSDIFVMMTRTGSCPSDNGPQWADWDGNSFGPNEEIKVISNGEGLPNNPYGIQYFGHPTFDKWGRYGLVGTYEDSPPPGTRIWDSQTNSFLPNYVLYDSYDGQHHTWAGWTDFVAGINPTTMNLQMNKYNESNTGPNFKVVCQTHHPGYSGNYNGYPRPSQSPDGTKIAFATVWLNNGGDDNPYISYAVAYYPYPPTNLTAVNDNGIKISWRPPTYTDRGWPDESSDPPPYAREIKTYHIWRSTSQNSGWSEIGAVDAGYHVDSYYSLMPNLDELIYTDHPADGTYYYALTSEEYSRLESKELSEILRVTVASGQLTGSSVVQAKGQKNFWTTPPSAPANVNVAAQSTAGHYLLTWEEPENSKIRYYNIYYSTGETPAPIRENRIASVPVGTSRYLDWCAQNTGASYLITSVDRQGNEGSSFIPSSGPRKPRNLKITK